MFSYNINDYEFNTIDETMNLRVVINDILEVVDNIENAKLINGGSFFLLNNSLKKIDDVLNDLYPLTPIQFRDNLTPNVIKFKTKLKKYTDIELPNVVKDKIWNFIYKENWLEYDDKKE